VARIQTASPGDDLTIYSGDGGAGTKPKNPRLQLCTHVAAGLSDWLGCVIEKGPALFFSAEEPEDQASQAGSTASVEIAASIPTASTICIFTFPDLEDTVLATADRSGKLQRTALMDRLEKTIETLQALPGP